MFDLLQLFQLIDVNAVLFFEDAFLVLGFEDDLAGFGFDAVVFVTGFLNFFAVLFLVLGDFEDFVLFLGDVEEAVLLFLKLLELVL